MQINLSSPISITLPRKTKKDKVCYLNLNNYRNWNFIISNQLKKEYKKIISEILSSIELSINTFDKCQIVYTFFSKNRIRKDIANCCAVIDKFFTDALVELGYLQDDSTDFIDCVVYRFGGIDKENPRCDITITDIIKY